jgi:hypothetical protein
VSCAWHTLRRVPDRSSTLELEAAFIEPGNPRGVHVPGRGRATATVVLLAAILSLVGVRGGGEQGKVTGCAAARANTAAVTEVGASHGQRGR